MCDILERDASHGMLGRQRACQGRNLRKARGGRNQQQCDCNVVTPRHLPKYTHRDLVISAPKPAGISDLQPCCFACSGSWRP